MRRGSHPSPSIALTADTNAFVQDTDEADHVTRLKLARLLPAASRAAGHCTGKSARNW
jgi:hypothetical protein